MRGTAEVLVKCIRVDWVGALFDEADELRPLRGQVVQSLAEQALGQHAVQVLLDQHLDLCQHLGAVVLAPLLQRRGIEPGLARIGLDAVKPPEVDEATRQQEHDPGSIAGLILHRGRAN